MSDYLIHQLARDRQQTLLDTATACHQAKAGRAARRLARKRPQPPTTPPGPTFDDAA